MIKKYHILRLQLMHLSTIFCQKIVQLLLKNHPVLGCDFTLFSSRMNRHIHSMFGYKDGTLLSLLRVFLGHQTS